jgi:anti-sigma-K factor RskA
MMEKTQSERSYLSYQKKIISYLDGSLSPDEKAEFEAFVRTHPEFEAHIKNKEDELLLLKAKIPATALTAETLSSLENEMKLSIFNLLKEEPKNFLDRIKDSWEEWTNR